jgi:hypothetical protein
MGLGSHVDCVSLQRLALALHHRRDGDKVVRLEGIAETWRRPGRARYDLIDIKAGHWITRHRPQRRGGGAECGLVVEGCGRRLDSYSACLDELSAERVISAVEEALASRLPDRSTRPWME